MVHLVAMMLLVGAATPHAPGKAKAPVSEKVESYEIEGKPVTADAFEAKRRTLTGATDSHCKMTRGGGVSTYKAHDAGGHWFLVSQVSGGSRPSSIAHTDAPKAGED